MACLSLKSLSRRILVCKSTGFPLGCSMFFDTFQPASYGGGFLPSSTPSSSLAQVVFMPFSSSQFLHGDKVQGPAIMDYQSFLVENEFHRLADDTIHGLQEKLEDFGDSIQIDGFDIDYGNHVLTLRLGIHGTYVINKQTPNRQIWLSSPVSGPSRFDWDASSGSWVYKRTKANLLQLLEEELQDICGKPVRLR